MSEEEERERLLPPEAPPAVAPPQVPSPPAAAGSGSSPPTVSSTSTTDSPATSGSCRICLEEDLVGNLEQPCSCSGTLRHAHKACLQKWVTEKGDLKCEICGVTYTGNYVVPPPAGLPTDAIPLISPQGNLYIVDSNSHYEEDRRLRQGGSASWCFSFFLFLMLFSSMGQSQAPAPSGSGPDPSSAPGSSSSSFPAPPQPQPAYDEYEVTLSMILLWIITKFVIILIPLYTIMRIAVRQAAQRHELDEWENNHRGPARPSVIMRPRRGRQAPLDRSSGSRPPSAGANSSRPPGAGGADVELGAVAHPRPAPTQPPSAQRPAAVGPEAV